MTSYKLIDMKTLTNVLLSLIKFGFGSYNELMNISIERIMKFYDWFMEDYKKDMENKVKYDTALLKAGCPLFRKKR